LFYSFAQKFHVLFNEDDDDNNNNNNNNNNNKFFIYLRAELNSEWPITESARIRTTAAIRQHRKKQIKKNR
jgi:hypothetical protein